MKYISILRGINVSGQKKIKMADLKALYESLGFKNVETYIQSGNVLFETNTTKVGELKIKIEKAISKKYGFDVPVEIRNGRELSDIINNTPFGALDLEGNGTKLLVTFLAAKPTATKITKLMEYVAAPEELVVAGREVYLHCPNGYGKTKLSNTFLERTLGVDATTRNWKSVCKLHEMASD